MAGQVTIFGVDLDRPMRIKKLTDSSVLKPGELLVVLHCLNQCGFDALGGSRKSIGAGVVQFYRHRQEPFHGLAGRRMADCSGAREQRMSGGLTSAMRRQKKSSNLTASPSNSGKDEIRICCPTPRRFISSVSAKLERASWNPTKEHKQRQPPNPQHSLLGLIKEEPGILKRGEKGQCSFTGSLFIFIIFTL